MAPGEGVDTVGPLMDSLRSTRSSRSVDSTGSSTSSRRIERLQGNLMRAQQSRDPMLIYEVMEIMGEGSMGSVSRVRKRIEAVGGSARAEFVLKHGSSRADKCCFGWLDLIKLPSQKNLMVNSSRTVDTTTTSDASGKPSSTSTTTSTTTNKNRKMYRQQSSMVKYDSAHKEAFYALKSIHLDRCSTKEYIDELKVREESSIFFSWCSFVTHSFVIVVTHPKPTERSSYSPKY